MGKGPELSIENKVLIETTVVVVIFIIVIIFLTLSLPLGRHKRSVARHIVCNLYAAVGY